MPSHLQALRCADSQLLVQSMGTASAPSLDSRQPLPQHPSFHLSKHPGDIAESDLAPLGTASAFPVLGALPCLFGAYSLLTAYGNRQVLTCANLLCTTWIYIHVQHMMLFLLTVLLFWFIIFLKQGLM